MVMSVYTFILLVTVVTGDAETVTIGRSDRWEVARISQSYLGLARE